MERMRRVATAVLFVVGVAGSVATTGPVADVSGVSDDQRAVLNAETPALAIGAVATLESDVAVTAGTGEIGLNVLLDDDAEGSLAFFLRSATTGAFVQGDIVDTQAQGTARIGIPAFDACAGGGACDERLTIELERTDAALEGDLGLTWNLDGLASTEGDAGDAAILFAIE